jgi:Rieske Fe-S protein
VNWEEDHHVTRRQFTSLLALLSGTFFLGAGLLGLQEWWRRRTSAGLGAARIASQAEVAVGGVKLFHYPTADDPCLLIRLSAERFVAYSQKCTHLSCPVIYRAAEMYCPCHEGRFTVEDGRVLAGPPQRPLPRVPLALRGEEIWATGVEV